MPSPSVFVTALLAAAGSLAIVTAEPDRPSSPAGRARELLQPQPQTQRQYRSPAVAPPVLVRRAASACELTYGTGSVECGSSEAMMCYNPSLGQTCCADNGYCDAGQYCAPVAGYCCLDSEDLHACAANAGFTLPANLSTASATATAALTPSVSSGSTTLTGTGDSSTSSSSSSGGSRGSGAGETSSYVQVSAVARKEQWTLVWMSLGIGIVGIIMATF